MKTIATAFLILMTVLTKAQNKISPVKDSTITFKVFGACEQCKDRIETAAKIKGVKKAVWDVDSKMLELTFNPAAVTLDKIENRIVAAGHDLENKKAKNAVYQQLPSCCHYREINAASSDSAVHTLPSDNSILNSLPPVNNSGNANINYINNAVIKGVVLESTANGSFTPLPGASVIWLQSKQGTTTDSNGVFNIPVSKTTSRLVISYTGYHPDTIYVSDNKSIKIVLASNKQLKEVTVTSRQRSTYIASMNPIRTQVMTEKELFKAACCNLSESFETNPSVDVSYSDAVTGAKQIQLLGLSGNYTQLTVENLPGPRGIATPLGLNSIAGPWVESIQLTKGIGSVANGYESIAGQINVELKKPESNEKMFANVYVNDFGKTDLNLNVFKKVSSRWYTGLLLHDDFLNNKKLDDNKDGFRDLPTGNQFNLINRWKYDDGKGWLAQLGVKLLTDQRTGGDVNFNTATDKYTTNKYGLGINTNRYEAFGKLGYVFPQQKYKSFGLQVSVISHRQDAFFGLTTYNAREQNLYANLIYQSVINNTQHKFRTGLSVLYDHYNELYKNTTYLRTEKVPGAFFEYTYTPSTKFSMVAGIRGDYHNLYGFFATPRIHLRYEPVKGTTIRMSAGSGQRTANIFAENMSTLVSARQVIISNPETGKAYGLNAEQAWNKGISIDQKIKLFHRDATISADYFRNDFVHQVVVDLEDPRYVKLYNLQGKSYSNSVQAELSFTPLKALDVRLAYRYFDVKTTYGTTLLQKPLTAAGRAFANLAYAIHGFKLDYTLNYTGKKRIPSTAANPAAYQQPDHSPAFLLMNAQVSKTLGKKHPFDIYVGAENITGYIQHNAIIAADQPFSNYFDAALVWGPVTGRMLYAGWRWKL